MRRLAIVLLTACGSASTPPTIVDNASDAPDAVAICPFALEVFSFWRHAFVPACGPPQLDDARIGCAGTCPTPCSESKTSSDRDSAYVTEFTYDASGRWLSSKYDANHGSDACTYEGPRIATCKDGDITFKYSAAGALEAVLRGGQSVMEASYENGRLARVLGPISAVLTYNAKGQLVQEEVDAPAGQFVLTYEYDAKGRLVHRRSKAKTDSDKSFDATYEYDAAGRLVKRVEPFNSGTATATYRYDARGRLVHVKHEEVLPENDQGPELRSWTELEYAYECR